MLNELINKDVEIIVAFGSFTTAGTIPEKYTGRLLSVDDEFCKIHSLKLRKNIIIAIKFIISVKEV